MKSQRGGEYRAPWEPAFDRVLTPLEEFIHRQTTSGVLLMLCGVIALFVANSAWSDAYHHFLAMTFSVGWPGLSLSMSVHHWINDGFMAVFFFVIGLELKRELMDGELSNPVQALLPIIAAVGGMLIPAMTYLAFNPVGHAQSGWGIPMATDIAFALGTLALVGSRVPHNLLTFLIALAIVDDLGAVLVIAFFYTESLDLAALAGVAGVLVLLTSLNLGGIRRPLPYVVLGIALWLAMLQSGVHATLAGVFLAFSIPMRPKYDPDRFFAQAKDMLLQIKHAYARDPNIIRNDELRARVRALEEGANLVQAPAQIMERKMHVPSAYLVIPIFALANAGIPIEWSSFGSLITHPIPLGIVAGLVGGKLVGVAGFTWLAVKLGLCHLPEGLTFRHIVGVGLMSGIGFTMSIFVAELGFAHHAEDLLLAKTGVLVASTVAGICGYAWLFFATAKNPTTVGLSKVD